MSEYVTRTMLPDDFATVLSGWQKNAPHDAGDADWFRSEVLPRGGDGCALIAEIDGKFAGFMCAVGKTIRGFYVLPIFRRQGIGTSLLDAVVADRRRLGHRGLSVSSNNYWCTVPGIDSRYEAAIAFLEQNDFSRGRPNHDVALDLPGMAKTRGAAAALTAGLRILDYDPAMLPRMQRFVANLNMPGWLWSDWEAKYSVQNNHVRIVAQDAADIIGWVDGVVSPNGTGGISYIAVLPQHRHKKIGSLLLNRAVCELRDRGASSVFAPYVPAPFYVSNGWRICREYVTLHRSIG